MPTTPVSPERQAEIADLEEAIRQAIGAEIGELAANLADADDAHLFGANEFKIRAIALKIAAKAYEQHLTRKKKDTTAPG
jgi:predicted trehalose synthase